MMLDEFGLTPEQRAQHLAMGRAQIKTNTEKNKPYGYIGIPVDLDDESTVLRFILLKEKLELKREELRQRAIARNNRQPTTPHICSPVLDSSREGSRGLMAKVRRFLGL